MKKLYLLLLAGTLYSSVTMAQIYVTEAGAGSKNGTSWAHAYDNTQLQQAINEAEIAPIKQVWVAKGTYKPTDDSSDSGTLTDNSPTTTRDKSFIIKNGVEIYGGFAGNEAFDPNAIVTRDLVANETILSGDLLGNDIADRLDPGYAASKADNVYHVVSARSNAALSTLDGFTIQHGFADGSGTVTIGGFDIAQSEGAGIAIRSTATSVAFKNLIIRDNEATTIGGGIYFRFSGAIPKYTLDKVNFINNVAGTSGGAAYINAASNGSLPLDFTNCTFDANKGAGTTSGTGGGAIFYTGNSSTDPILNITDCAFLNGQHQNYGAFIRANAGTINIVNSSFENGVSASWAGAIYSTTSAVLNINASVFKNNTGSSGGHLYLYTGKLNCLNTKFLGGSAGTGGAIYAGEGVASIIVSESDFIGNTTTGAAGAIYSVSSVNISKCRFFNNTAGGRGGVFELNTTPASANVTSKIDNSLFYNNVSNHASNGGGVFYLSRLNPGQLNNLTVTNCTFYSNHSTAGTWGVLAFFNSTNVTLNLYNNIFYGNTDANGPADLRMIISAKQNFSNNLFQSFNLTAGSDDTFVNNTLNNSPGTIFASTTYGDNNFLWPVNNSVTTDKGDNTLYSANVEDLNVTSPTPVPTDLLGNPRANGTIDLGAIEWSTVLPVKVSSFTANLVNGRTQLKWSVGTEDNVNRYEIERSQNGTYFTTVATVGANGAASYGTTDNSPAPGVNYYRLVTVDNDGVRKAYGQLQTVTVASLTATVQAYPNPIVGSIVHLTNLNTGTYQYKLINTAGGIVQEGELQGPSSHIELSAAVVKGVYILHLVNGTTTEQVKLIKQ